MGLGESEIAELIWLLLLLLLRELRTGRIVRNCCRSCARRRVVGVVKLVIQIRIFIKSLRNSVGFMNYSAFPMSTGYESDSAAFR